MTVVTPAAPSSSHTNNKNMNTPMLQRRKHSHSSDHANNDTRSDDDEDDDADADVDSSDSCSPSPSHSMGNGTDGEYDDDDDVQSHDGEAPPFLPLEVQNHHNHEKHHHNHHHPRKSKTAAATAASILGVASSTLNPLLEKLQRYIPNKLQKITGKHVVSLVMFSIIGLVFWDVLFTDPKDRYLQPEASLKLLQWVQQHPLQGIIWITLVIAACVVVMIPLGTPLTLGCGYVYKGAYGWKAGVMIATLVSMGGSGLGAVVCFLLGRYLMRDTVKKWIRKYPLFDAIDVAAAEHGLKIMAMLYLTPVLPLGPVSYMCGTTSMPLSSFVLAKVAALPLMLLYVFIGASMGALIGGDPNKAAVEVQKIEENEYLIASGIFLSFVTIACITRQVKKELNKILERQQKLKPGESEPLTTKDDNVHAAEDAALEMGITKRRRERA